MYIGKEGNRKKDADYYKKGVSKKGGNHYVYREKKGVGKKSGDYCIYREKKE